MSESRGTGVSEGEAWSGIDKGSVGMRIGQKEHAPGWLSSAERRSFKRVNAAEKSTASDRAREKRSRS